MCSHQAKLSREALKLVQAKILEGGFSHYNIIIRTMQAKSSHKKGCVLFVVHISSDKGKDVEDAEIIRGTCIVAVSGFVSSRRLKFSFSQGSGLFY